MPGKRGALRPRESAYDIDAFLLYFEKKGLKNEGLLLFAKLSKIVGNWCFPEKITMEKDQVPHLTTKLNRDHRTRRELKLSSSGSPKGNCLLLTAVILMVVYGGGEHGGDGVGGSMNPC